MSLRLIAALALALGVFAGACGDGASIPDDPRVLEIGFVAEEATYVFARVGAEGLYDFLAPEVAQRCSREQFGQALAGQAQPTGFRGLKRVKFEGDDARVTVIIIAGGRDQDVEWVFARNPQPTDATGFKWYLTQVPGIEGCGG